MPESRLERAFRNEHVTPMMYSCSRRCLPLEYDAELLALRDLLQPRRDDSTERSWMNHLRLGFLPHFLVRCVRHSKDPSLEGFLGLSV